MIFLLTCFLYTAPGSTTLTNSCEAPPNFRREEQPPRRQPSTVVTQPTQPEVIYTPVMRDTTGKPVPKLR